MITYKKGNLLEARGVIVHGCNAQGAYGSGVAGQIRKKWPNAYEGYMLLIEHYGIGDPSCLGEISWCPVGEGIVVGNMVTQRYYGYDGRKYVDYTAVQDAFENLIESAVNLNLPKVINFPKIGCGLAGGDWEIVSKIIDTVVPDDIEKICWEL